MRLIPIALIVASACGSSQIENLPMAWRGVDDTPHPSREVSQALQATPITFELRDVRPDPTAVGTYEEDGFVVRTRDNVGQFASTHVGEMLENAGARLRDPPVMGVATELVEFKVVEGNTFRGTARLHVLVHRGPNDPVWSKIYVGTSHRIGRSHSPENFNEALSSALEDATSHLLDDDDFAHALQPAEAAAASGS